MLADLAVYGLIVGTGVCVVLTILLGLRIVFKGWPR